MEEKVKKFIDRFNYDGKRTYCIPGYTDAWREIDGVMMLPLEGWMLSDLEKYIIPFITEEAYINKGWLCVNVSEIEG